MQSWSRRTHFEGLDALRAAAALSVLGLHLTLFDRPHGLFSHGYLGVDLFFSLSGYVIGHVYEPELAAGKLSLSKYGEIRLVRLMPMIWLGAMLGALVAGLGYLPQDHIALFLICQMLMIPRWGAGLAFPLNGAQWSLFFELAVNAVHALAVPKLTTSRLAMAVLIFGAMAVTVTLVLGTANYGFAGRHFPLGGVRAAFGFCGGLLLYRLMCSGHLKPAGAVAAQCGLPLFCCVVAMAGAWPRFGAAPDLAAVFVVIPVAVWLGSSATYPPLLKRVALQAGLVSYPLYAAQGPILHLLGSGPADRHGTNPTMASAVLICATAYVVQVSVDAPVRRLLARILALRRSGRHMALTP